MIKKITYLMLCWPILISCDRAVPVASQTPIVQSEDIIASDQDFYKDGKGGLFNNLKWYIYNFSNHFIYSVFDIYALKSRGEYFQLQISSYYENDTPGIYTLYIKDSDDAVESATVDAKACGNSTTNPDYYPCMGNPAKNAFTYLNLRTKDSWVMTDSEALGRQDWDIAFKTTEVKLNSGLSGPGDVVGSLLFRNQNLFDGAAINLEALVAEVRSEGWRSYFEDNEDTEESSLSYYPQDGIDRIIYEDFWWQTSAEGSRLKTVNSENWWVIRSPRSGYFYKLRAKDIVHYDDESILSFEVQEQSPIDDAFQDRFRDIEINPIVYDQKFQTQCIYLDSGSSGACQDDLWDIKLVVANTSDSESVWRIFVNSGAYGPLSFEEVQNVLKH